MLRNSFKIFSLAVLLSLAPALAEAAKLSLASEGSVTGVSGWDPTRRSEDNMRGQGVDLNLYLQPLISMKDGSWLITPNYDFDYSSVNNVIVVDEEVFLYYQHMTNRIELGGAWRSRGGQRIGLKAFHTAVNGVGSVDEKLSTGVYNYNDSGLKASYSIKTPSRSNYSVGLSTYGRKYPHYLSLDAAQRHEKDAAVAKFNADAEINWPTKTPFMSLLSYSLQSANYTDAPIIDETGTTNTAADGGATMRRDIVHTFGLTLPFEFGASKWGIGYALEARNSNVNHLDSSQFVYIPSYNSYVEHGMLFSFAWDFEGPWWVLQAPEITLDADVHYRLYDERLAKKSDGTYEQYPAKQADNRYQARIGFNSPVTKHWAFNSSMDFLGVTSNNLDATSSLVNYKFYTLRVGAQFSY